MRVWLVMLGAASLALFTPHRSDGFDRSAQFSEPEDFDGRLSTDCLLEPYDVCSGWIWVYDDVPGAVWGVVIEPGDCTQSCENGLLSDIWVYGRANGTVGEIAELAAWVVDASNCRTDLLWRQGPITSLHCVANDRWTQISTPLTDPHGRPIAITVTWAGDGSVPALHLATDCSVSNLYCRNSRAMEYPGCSREATLCTGWRLEAQRTFIYITDIDEDGDLDDMCELYGSPYPLAFPYVEGYGYLSNNLLIRAGFECALPTAVDPTSWGRVKALYQ